MTLLGPQPRYRQLAQTLINEIESGRYPVGNLLPTEFELCEQFGASRFTVREAIKQLVRLGLVDRQPGVGTRVKIAQPSSEYRQVMQRLADLQQYSAQTELRFSTHRPSSWTKRFASCCGERRDRPGCVRKGYAESATAAFRYASRRSTPIPLFDRYKA